MPRVLRALGLWLRTAVRAAPLLVVLQCLFAVARAVTAPMQTYGVKLLVDGLTQNTGGSIAWGIAVILVGFAIMFGGELVGGPIQDTTGEKVFGQVFEDVLDTVSSIPGITHHEHPDTANRIEYIRENAWKLGTSLELLLFLVATLANTIAVLTLLGTVHPALLLIPLLGTARIWSAYKSTRWRNDAFESMMPQARLVDRLMDIIKDPKHALELRVFGLRGMLVDRLAELQDARARRENRAMLHGSLLDGGVRIGFGIAYALAIVWAISVARNGTLTAGEVALVILIAPQVDQLTGGIAGNVYWLGEVLRMFMRYDWLRQYGRKHAWTDATEPALTRLRSGLELRSVSFAYPGANRPVVSDISLLFPAGSTVALVGENGAGKTTLVKLLARMYDPTQGSVFVDGVDLRTIDAAAWRHRISAGFQDFVKFEFLAREAVGIGDLERLEDHPTIRTALDRADAGDMLDDMPEGLHAQLGRRFANGQDLSGGQWQRVALARAFMRQQPLLLLLDEPTAALDPEAEHALFERFAAASKTAATYTGGITVLVSHRFSTVRMADQIVVLNGGRVTEVGTHEELVDAGGQYAELFSMQARAYR